MELWFSLVKITDDDTSPELRTALEIHVAAHFRTTAEDPSTWTRPFPALGRTPGLRARAQRIVSEHANVSPQALAEADAVAQAFLASERKPLEGARSPEARRKVVVASAIYALCATAILALIGALLLRGGFTFRTFGLAIVTNSGVEASRIRAVGRAVIAWSPAILMVLLPRVSHNFTSNARTNAVLGVSVALLMIAGAVFAIVSPARGIPDRLAGTWIVPK
jgi:hypothetical protein